MKIEFSEVGLSYKSSCKEDSSEYTQGYMLSFLLPIIFLLGVHNTPEGISWEAEIPWCVAEKKEISITFDDGPHPANTLAILEILKSEHVPATFFVVGNRVERYPDIVKKVSNAGYTIGNHSYDHAKLNQISTFSYIQEILRTNLAIWSITGKYPHFLRFPYWLLDERIGNFYSGPIIGWNVDAYDWKMKNPAILAKRIIAQTKPWSIILLHDIKQDTVNALPAIIIWLKEAGYTFVSLDRLIEYSPSKNYRNEVFLSRSIHHHISKNSSQREE